MFSLCQATNENEFSDSIEDEEQIKYDMKTLS